MNAQTALDRTYEYPEKMAALFEPRRYKVLHGGRGGAKSWAIARALLEIGLEHSIRVGCCREVQKSIKESVHALLKIQIEMMGLGWAYEVQEQRIFSKVNGTEFVFFGLRTHNVESIKSFEGLDIVWVEEARNVSKQSWDVLIPTIRKEPAAHAPCAEIWISLNPELDDDETYKRFIKNADDRMTVIQVNWSDNPWFPKVLDDERRAMQSSDPDGYLTTWEGKTRLYLDGAIYAEEIRKAHAEGRITKVPYDPTKPVHTFWDLGHRDSTAIWLVQFIGFEKRIIGYVEAHSQPLDYYVRTLKEFPYLWGTDWLPHDARAKTIATGRSVEEMMREMGRDVRIVPNLSVTDGINAARMVFAQCYFDAEAAGGGLNRLKKYCYEIDERGQRSRLPLHDENSHGADAWRYMAVAGDQHGQDRMMGRPNMTQAKRAGIV